MSTVLDDGELEADFKSGVWDKEPWFLDAKYEELFAEAGFSLELRKRSVACLQRVYPPAVCREMLQRSWGDGGVILSLFREYLPLRLVPLLKLGLDLEVVSPDWDSPLVKRLRTREHYRATEFEFAIWANLKRYGYEFVREPTVDGNKKPDFLLYLDRRRYVLELKTLNRSELDALAKEVSHEFDSISSDATSPHRLTTVKPSPLYVEKYKSPEGRGQVLSELSGIVKAFGDGVKYLQAAGFAPGRYEVEPFGYFEVTNARYKLGAFECNFVPELSLHRWAIKLMNTIKEACRQLPSSAVGILLIDVESLAGVELLQAQLRAKEHENPRLFRNCNLVLLRGAISGLEGGEAGKIGVVVVPMGKHRLTAAEEGLVKALMYGVSRDWLRVPERWRSVYAGRIELKPGETGTFKIDWNDL